jgi:gamma-glutamylcyclotransferase (GGCT)/AIG2-like uncharacterized protein YtfP
MPSSYLFVYGTLKSTYQHPMHQSLLRYAMYAGEGFFMGKLYRIDWYPGMVASDNEQDKVFGELYEIVNEQALFELLDEYEDYRPADEDTSDYLRRKVTIYKNKTPLEAWTYLYNKSVMGLEVLVSGVF